jgi:hypothetical protein
MDDLKSRFLPKAEKKPGSSPDGLTQAEAQKHLRHPDAWIMPMQIV